VKTGLGRTACARSPATVLTTASAASLADASAVGTFIASTAL